MKKNSFSSLVFSVITCLLTVCLLLTTTWAFAGTHSYPEPDPPVLSSESTGIPSALPKGLKGIPSKEWTYHKSSDNLHPDGNEQQMLWLMNRARSNPVQEGIWLSNTGDQDIISAIHFFSVDLNALKSEFAALSVKPPAAFDVRLYNAAKVHSDDLIARNAQDHDNQFTQVTSAGFSFMSIRGNVFSYSLDALYGHAAFNIDWGESEDGTGMQTGRGHRQAIMSMDGNYTNAGIAAVKETNPATDVGPLVITGNYASANDSNSDHFNRFIVGTVWKDLNQNGMYDPGEGIGNITVTPDKGTYYAVTSGSGGYAIPASSGDYQVTFSGTGLTQNVTKSITVGTQSILLDLLTTGAGTGDGGGSGSNTSTDSNSGGKGGCFIDALML